VCLCLLGNVGDQGEGDSEEELVEKAHVPREVRTGKVNLMRRRRRRRGIIHIIMVMYLSSTCR